MVNPVQHYVWGSPTAIPRLQGRDPSGRPEAELWMGAHPASPSSVEVAGRRLSLLEVIEQAPEQVLGHDVTTRFGARLPYLLKVLAADQPLSLQAHPSEAQARQGFHAEDALDIPIDAPERNYRDPSAKPELLCALSPVDALCGFREPAETLELLGRLQVARLRPLTDILRGCPEGAMPAAVEHVLTWPRDDRAALVGEVRAAAARMCEDDRGFSAEASWVLRLAELYPADPGVVAALLLNLIRLEPGEALYLPSGNMHAYLGGFGVEVMANSDNVLRGGLTVKHVDVPELQRILDHRAGPISVVLPKPVTDNEIVYTTTAPNFQLSRLNVSAKTPAGLSSFGPQILLCTYGNVEVRHRRDRLSLGRGESAFVPAAADSLEVRGDGVVFRAMVPREEPASGG